MRGIIIHNHYTMTDMMIDDSIYNDIIVIHIEIHHLEIIDTHHLEREVDLLIEEDLVHLRIDYIIIEKEY